MMNATLQYQRCTLLTPLSAIEPCEVDWLWEPYLPKGMLSLLSGDPGAGKTYLALAIAAALSKGRTPANTKQSQAVNTIYLSRENSPEFVVRPRFDLLGGDANRFYLLPDTVSLDDASTLDSAIRDVRAGLVIVDPFQSFIGSDVDTYRANETRPILDGLIEIASETACCILLVRHLSKSSGGRAIHRGLGSVDITAAARTELLAGVASDDDSKRAIIQIKNNVGPIGEPLGYRVNNEGLTWTGKSDLTAQDLLSPDCPTPERSHKQLANEYLKEKLASGPRLQSELATESLFAERTLQRAAASLGVKKSRVGERGPWQWQLP
jgi:hypothetical protein